MDVFAVLLRSTRRLKMLLKSRSNTWQTEYNTTQEYTYLIVFVPMTWLSAAILWYVSGLERFEDDSGAFCCATLRPHIVRWKMSTFRTQMAMATSVQAFKIVFNFELLYDLFYKLSKCADRKRNSKKRGQRTTLYNCSGPPRSWPHFLTKAGARLPRPFEIRPWPVWSCLLNSSVAVSTQLL